MKYWVYIYGRTFVHDFRSICIPPASIANTTILEEFAKQVINTDKQSNGPLSNKRYAFYKFEKHILWGVGFSHVLESFKEFGLEGYENDCKPRRLRSFVGIIIDYSDFHRLDSIPYDDSFFFSLFEKYLTPYWQWPEFKKWKPICSEMEYYTDSHNGLSLNGNVQFNNDYQNCLFFPYEEERNVLSSIKNCYTCLITGLNVESHVFSSVNASPSVIINNAVCLETQKSHITQIINNSQTTIGTPKPTKTIAFSSQGGLKKYKIKNNHSSIAVSSSVDWITVSCAESLLQVTVKPNTNNSHREGVIFIVRGSDKEKIFVRQDAHEDSLIKKGIEFFKDRFFSDRQDATDEISDLKKQEFYTPTISSYSPKVDNESYSEEKDLNEKLMDWGEAWNSSDDSGKTNDLNNETSSVETFDIYKKHEHATNNSSINESELNSLMKELIQKHGINEVYLKIKNIFDNE